MSQQEYEKTNDFDYLKCLGCGETILLVEIAKHEREKHPQTASEVNAINEAITCDRTEQIPCGTYVRRRLYFDAVVPELALQDTEPGIIEATLRSDAAAAAECAGDGCFALADSAFVVPLEVTEGHRAQGVRPFRVFCDALCAGDKAPGPAQKVSLVAKLAEKYAREATATLEEVIGDAVREAIELCAQEAEKWGEAIGNRDFAAVDSTCIAARIRALKS